MLVVGVHVPLGLIALIALILLIVEYRKPEHPTKGRNTMIYGGILAVCVGIWLYMYYTSAQEMRMCSYSTTPTSECDTEASYPALVLFKMEGCLACNYFACTWNEAVDALRKNNIPVATYVIDSSNRGCKGLLDADKVTSFPTIRYYYDAQKYDEFTGDRTPENFGTFIKTKITDHISPAGATAAKPSDNAEKYGYVNVNTMRKEGYGGNYHTLAEMYTHPSGYEPAYKY